MTDGGGSKVRGGSGSNIGDGGARNGGSGGGGVTKLYDAIMIGSGQGGNPLSQAFARAGMRTALVERAQIGGTCINVGCTPTKTMVASARQAWLARRSGAYGVHVGDVRVALAEVRRRKQSVVESFRNAGRTRLEAAEGLDLLFGEARFTGPRRIEVRLNDGGAVTLEAPRIVIDVGCRPADPGAPGLPRERVLDSTSIMELGEIPPRLLVLGGGYVGLEFAQMFRRFGSEVVVVQRGRQLLSKEDPDVAEAVAAILREDGIEVLLETRVVEGGAGGAAAGGEPTAAGATRVSAAGRSLAGARGAAAAGEATAGGGAAGRGLSGGGAAGGGAAGGGAAGNAAAGNAQAGGGVAGRATAEAGIWLRVVSPSGERRLEGTHVLAAAGRVPNTERLGLEAAGIRTDSRGYITVNDRLETSADGVWAIGDVNGGPAFTHISYDDFRILRQNLLGDGGGTTNGRFVPYALFTDPQLGRVGMTEAEARASGRNVRVAKLPMAHVARAIEVGETRGFLKAVVDNGSGEILGFAALGLEGGEIMAMIEIAMMGSVPWPVLKDATFAHPTLAESLNNLFLTFDE